MLVNYNLMQTKLNFTAKRERKLKLTPIDIFGVPAIVDGKGNIYMQTGDREITKLSSDASKNQGDKPSV